MSLETLQLELEHVLNNGDPEEIRDFLDDQNISDVAELIYNEPDFDAQIVSGMSIHRAAGVFKILEFPTQQDIIQKLPPRQNRRTAERVATG